jgi:hypothetical protein
MPAVREMTAERLRLLLAYEPMTGVFAWRIAPRGHTAGKAGTVNTSGYVQIKVDGRLYYAHRLAWLHMHGEWPAGEVDHRNGIRTDNSAGNLRVVSRTTNSENVRAAHRDSVSGLLGASWSKSKGRWYSRIRIKGQSRFLGYFDHAAAAHDAYLSAKRESHEGNTL